ncbi:hypothetical protein CAPTEDRAFT_227451 [Capitella teleta]|uniref:Protein kinase domain-containing protein n=1 Tax=Capitella teleta TaxID=283909 RepID=R7USV5_CAPTE|nr:hypothetical protein CAPTEDRAFT_227451 [Capitella teleta]|eukprot:ELU09554.1 hypothetical protein CAPTEDRAFT_227451 [Capitella teleta]
MKVVTNFLRAVDVFSQKLQNWKTSDRLEVENPTDRSFCGDQKSHTTIFVCDGDLEAAAMSPEPTAAALMTPRTRTISNYVTTPTVPADFAVDEQSMDLEILDRKMRRLVQKVKKHDIPLEVFDDSDIAYGPMLGKGGEGIVYKCTVMYNGIPIDAAVKKIFNSSDDAISMTLDEIELLCLARDPIVATTLQVYGMAAVPSEPDSDVGHLVIITEVGQMNALQLYQSESVPLHVTLDFWARISAGVSCMHSKHILHQDLKPENLLITGVDRDTFGQIKRLDFRIIDFGMAKRFFTEKVNCDEILGTNGYHAPEVLQDEDYDFRADIFMLGITFCVMLHGQSFLKSGCLAQLLLQIHEAKHVKTGSALFGIIFPALESHRPFIPPAIRQMLCCMLEKQDRRTISLVDVVRKCRKESEVAQLEWLERNDMAPGLRPHSDSGISSSACSVIKVRRERRRKKLSSPIECPKPSVMKLRAKRSQFRGAMVTPNTKTAVSKKTPRVEVAAEEEECTVTPLKRRLRKRPAAKPSKLITRQTRSTTAHNAEGFWQMDLEDTSAFKANDR